MADNNMKEITIFAKRRTTQDGRAFHNFLATLDRNDGTTETVRVCFRQDDGQPSIKPETCPRNIKFKKESANMAVRRYKDKETGEQKESKTLWIAEWEKGSEYVDHSMDDYF